MQKRNNLHIGFPGCLLLLGVLLTSCQKEHSNASVNIKVTHEGLSVAQATVYLNRDSTYHPDSLNDEYDRSLRADASGEASFHNLEPGTYYIYATGNEAQASTPVEGMDSLVVRARNRQNSYDLEVKTFDK